MTLLSALGAYWNEYGNGLALNNNFSNRNVFQNGINSFFFFFQKAQNFV